MLEPTSHQQYNVIAGTTPQKTCKLTKLKLLLVLVKLKQTQQE
jgi:hypothetical protein